MAQKYVSSLNKNCKNLGTAEKKKKETRSIKSADTVEMQDLMLKHLKKTLNKKSCRQSLNVITVILTANLNPSVSTSAAYVKVKS